MKAFVAKRPEADVFVVEALPIYAVPEVKSVGAERAVEDALTVKNEAKRNVVEPRPHTPSPVGVMFPFTCRRSVAVLVPIPVYPREETLKRDIPLLLTGASNEKIFVVLVPCINNVEFTVVVPIATFPRRLAKIILPLLPDPIPNPELNVKLPPVEDFPPDAAPPFPAVITKLLPLPPLTVALPSPPLPPIIDNVPPAPPSPAPIPPPAPPTPDVKVIAPPWPPKLEVAPAPPACAKSVIAPPLPPLPPPAVAPVPLSSEIALPACPDPGDPIPPFTLNTLRLELAFVMYAI